MQLPLVWARQNAPAPLPPQLLASTVNHIQKKLPKGEHLAETVAESPAEPAVNYAFYRKHTENLLRRYLYASMQVGRAPDILGECVGRGWVSSRPVRTFEDALIFVLDVERCLKRLNNLDRQLISRVLIQEYSHAEAAVILRISHRSVYVKLPQAVDRLTERLVEANLLSLPG